MGPDAEAPRERIDHRTHDERSVWGNQFPTRPNPNGLGDKAYKRRHEESVDQKQRKLRKTAVAKPQIANQFGIDLCRCVSRSSTLSPAKEYGQEHPVNEARSAPGPRFPGAAGREYTDPRTDILDFSAQQFRTWLR